MLRSNTAEVHIEGGSDSSLPLAVTSDEILNYPGLLTRSQKLCYLNCTKPTNTVNTGGVCVIQINYRDPRPIYEQLRDGFRQLILTGVLEPNAKMPSVR